MQKSTIRVDSGFMNKVQQRRGREPADTSHSAGAHGSATRTWIQRMGLGVGVVLLAVAISALIVVISVSKSGQGDGVVSANSGIGVAVETRPSPALATVVEEAAQQVVAPPPAARVAVQANPAPAVMAATVPSRAPPVFQTNNADRVTAHKQVFAHLDLNRDGKVTEVEYQKRARIRTNIPARFKNEDRNGDGFITEQEFVEARAK